MVADDDKDRFNTEKADMIAKGLMPADVPKSKRKAKDEGEGQRPTKMKKKDSEDMDEEDEGDRSDAEVSEGGILDYERRGGRGKDSSRKSVDWRKELFEEGDFTAAPGEKSGEFEFVF
jgi:hypothetical protein